MSLIDGGEGTIAFPTGKGPGSAPSFSQADGLIDLDIAAHLDLPRMPRLLPETLSVSEVERLLDAAGSDAADDPRLPERAMLELRYAAVLRVPEALRLDLGDL